MSPLGQCIGPSVLSRFLAPAWNALGNANINGVVINNQNGLVHSSTRFDDFLKMKFLFQLILCGSLRRPHTHARMLSRTHTHSLSLPPPLHTHTHARSRTHARTHAHTHTHAHARTHTHLRWRGGGGGRGME